VGGTSRAPTTAVQSAPAALVSQVASLGVEPQKGPAVNAPELYQNFRVVCRFETLHHIAHMAPTDTEGESAFVALAAPTKQLVVEWVCERVGGPPQIPPADLGTNYVLLGETKQPVSLDTAPDGVTPVTRTAGSRIYGVRKAALVAEGCAIPPWLITQLQNMKKTGDAALAAGIDRMLSTAAVTAGGIEVRGILPWAGGGQ
jgi:hypothetical protein